MSNLNYLGTEKSNQGGNNEDIKHQIGEGKLAIQYLPYGTTILWIK